MPPWFPKKAICEIWTIIMTELQTPLLELRNAVKEFRSGSMFSKSVLRAVDSISLTINEDKPLITAIAGESGSGKTTLGKLILGLTSPTEGEILYKGKLIRDLKGGERREYRQNVQAIFQDPFAVYNPFYKVDHLFDAPIKKYKLSAVSRPYFPKNDSKNH